MSDAWWPYKKGNLEGDTERGNDVKVTEVRQRLIFLQGKEDQGLLQTPEARKAMGTEGASSVDTPI